MIPTATSSASARTLYDKLWDEHVVRTEDDGTATLYIDRHLVHEVTSPQAFDIRQTQRSCFKILKRLYSVRDRWHQI